jgi:hypothetical protein
MPVPDSL